MWVAAVSAPQNARQGAWEAGAAGTRQWNGVSWTPSCGATSAAVTTTGREDLRRCVAVVAKGRAAAQRTGAARCSCVTARPCRRAVEVAMGPASGSSSAASRHVAWRAQLASSPRCLRWSPPRRPCVRPPGLAVPVAVICDTRSPRSPRCWCRHRAAGSPRHVTAGACRPRCEVPAAACHSFCVCLPVTQGAGGPARGPGRGSEPVLLSTHSLFRRPRGLGRCQG